MPERRRLAMMSQLLAVQRAQRSAAEIALAEARRVEAREREGEQAAIAACDAALQSWTQCVAEAGFSPEYSRMLSAALIERDAEATNARARAEATAQLALRREQDWRALEAQVRAGSTTGARLCRKLVQRSEERRLAALADQVTRTWRPS